MFASKIFWVKIFSLKYVCTMNFLGPYIFNKKISPVETGDQWNKSPIGILEFRRELRAGVVWTSKNFSKHLLFP